MSSAAVMIQTRQKLWDDLKGRAEWSSNRVDRVTKLIASLTKQINRRTYNPEQVKLLLEDVARYSRNYRRIASKLKLSKRAVKFILKKQRNGKGKNQKLAKRIPSPRGQAKDLFCP